MRNASWRLERIRVIAIVTSLVLAGFLVISPKTVLAPPLQSTLNVTFHDLAPSTNTYPGDVNVSMIWLEMTASGGDAQVYSMNFTLSGTIHPNEISNVALWDDTTPDGVQQSIECELARTPATTSTFTVPRTGNLSECVGPANYVVNDLQTRYILVLISVNATAVTNNTIRLDVTAINADVTVNGGTESTREIEVSSIFFSDDMESGQGGWTREGWDEGLMHTPDGLWHLSQGEEVCKNSVFGQPFFHSYNTSWWYGHRYEDPSDPGTFVCDYYTHEPGDPFASTRNWGKLRTPWIDARSAGSLAMTFWHLLSKERSPIFDRTHVFLNDSSRWHLISTESVTDDQWKKLTLDLSEYAGKRVQLEFRFDEVDTLNNKDLGWLIDDLAIYGKYITILPPTNLTTKVVGDDVLLEWDASLSPALDYYLIYGAMDQREFDFSIPLYNTSNDSLPLRTNWTDTGAAEPGSASEYYYVVRAVASDCRKSVTSNTAGKWTKSFKMGFDAFSLPLRPFDEKNTSWYADTIPNVDFIRWMDSTGHWVTHYPSMGSGINDSPARMGETYEISLLSTVNFTFCGYPAAMVRFQEGLGDSVTFRKSLSAQLNENDINLTWEAVTGASRYLIFRSERREGLHEPPLDPIANTTDIYWRDLGVVGSGTGESYYMIIPLDSNGDLGSSTYSTGVATVNCTAGSDTFALPLKLAEYRTLDWYCDNVPNVVGIAYVIFEMWKFHAKEMPEGVYDVEALQGEGYQISIDGATTTYTFVGY